MNLKEYIQEQFNNGSFEGKTERFMATQLEFKSKSEKQALANVLKELVSSGVLAVVDGRYVPFEKSGFLKGKLCGFENGYAFLIREDGGADIFIPHKGLNGAYHEDTVYVRVLPESEGSSDEGEVVKIIERGIKQFTGVFRKNASFGTVTPDDKRLFSSVKVVRGRGIYPKDGEKVFCKIIEYPFDSTPVAIITQIVGKQFSLSTEEKCVLLNHNAPKNFGREIMKEVSLVSDEVLDNQLIGRLDLRNLLTVTIDGDSARDFDDAISVEKNEVGFKLYVHIADVSEYVVRDSALDREAFERGTSIYLPDKVIPMLPEKLSNGICSLNPNVDRLTLSAIMQFDGNGKMVEKSFYKSIINSNHRLTYKQVQAYFDGENNFIAEDESLRTMLDNANALKNLMVTERDKKGYVNLETQDAAVVIEESGEFYVEQEERLESEKLIEQFMISANVAVAEYLYYLSVPAIYRTHAKPSEEKLENFKLFLRGIGITVRWHDGVYPGEFQKLLVTLKDNKLYGIVNDVMLRSMQKAVYSATCSGHFGLNENFYCHFTSPIRRYPDIVVHRILKGVLDGRLDEIIGLYDDFCPIAAKKSTQMEQRADEIERAVDNIYICDFMSQFIGDYFEGIISGVTSRGVYVRLENAVEGMIKLEYLPKGEYKFDSSSFSLSSGKNSFRLGESLLVRLVACDMTSGKLAFSYIKKFKRGN